MSARVIRAGQFTADRAWGSTRLAVFGEVEANLHWADAGYPWHVNEGDELFVVLDGRVDMHWRRPGEPAETVTLQAGDAWSGLAGIEHRAVPHGEARMLVIEAPVPDVLVAG